MESVLLKFGTAEKAPPSPISYRYGVRRFFCCTKKMLPEPVRLVRVQGVCEASPSSSHCLHLPHALRFGITLDGSQDYEQAKWGFHCRLLFHGANRSTTKSPRTEGIPLRGLASSRGMSPSRLTGLFYLLCLCNTNALVFFYKCTAYFLNNKDNRSESLFYFRTIAANLTTSVN
jgi:hypothetical protein